MKCRLSVILFFICFRSVSQTQTCPINIDFASGTLNHWYAYTGNNAKGNGPDAIKQRYDSNFTYPNGTLNVTAIPEYLYSVNGIQVVTYNSDDPFGGFPTIPNINGYQYGYSIKLGSTSITRGNSRNGNAGGYVRGLKYSISVPPGPTTEPYTMTYAYAMVLENGTHISQQQALMSVTLMTDDGIIQCASPSYYLPTFGNVNQNGQGATLDSATAKANGFKVSRLTSPNFNPFPTGGGEYLQDVWFKGWTEVTFDLAPYRGKKVSLILEADNCVPGGHFAYGYVAFRNNCGGLEISGDTLVCNNSVVTYSVPALDGAIYKWDIPDSWTVISGENSNILRVKSSQFGGNVSVNEKNSCANLTDVFAVKTLPSPEAGRIAGSGTVCELGNSSILTLQNYSGTVKGWIYSTDSVNWLPLDFNGPVYTSSDLTRTTYFKAVVEKGTVCAADTSDAAVISVDSKSVGGKINPDTSTFCKGQPFGVTMKLSENVGSVRNWQFSTDGISWTDVQPAHDTTALTIHQITLDTRFRLIDQNGVCPPDTSIVAVVRFAPELFPVASVSPADTTICFGTRAFLNASVETGTRYSWMPILDTSHQITAPFQLTTPVDPVTSTDYILSVFNDGCPNPLMDTFHVTVLDKIIVDAGGDTSVVVGQPVQFHAVSSEPRASSFTWTPSDRLNNPNIANPVGFYSWEDASYSYTVTASTPEGCTGEAFVKVKVFNTMPDIFVPNAFTPGKAANAIFRPIPVGIGSLQYFRIYNRQGELVYSTTTLGAGWDGTLNGQQQGSGGFVWMVRGTDFTGKVITKKGTMVLIR